MSYINTVDFASWHIPCYSRHNCGSRARRVNAASASSKVQKAGPGGGGLADAVLDADPESAAAKAFTILLLALALVGFVLACAGLCAKNGLRRPLHVFVMSLMASDLVLVLFVMPVHLLSAGSAEGPPAGTCLAWMYFQLAAVAARSWSLPAVSLLLHFYDGAVPISRK